MTKEHITKLTDEIRRLKSQLQDSHQKHSKLEKTAGKSETEVRAPEQRNKIQQQLEREIELLQNQYNGAQDELKETNKALESTMADSSRLRKRLDNVEQRAETISSSSSLQQSQRIELEQQKEELIRQSTERQAIIERQRDKVNRMLDSMTTERDELQSQLNDARSGIAKKADTIRSLTSSKQHSQDVMEAERKTLVESSEMKQTVQRQVKALEENLANVNESYKTTLENLRQEVMRTKEKDNQLAETMSRLQVANLTIEKREADLSLAHRNYEQEAESMHTELQKRADNLGNAQRKVERQTSQVTALRQDLDLARSEAKARDKDVQELEKKLEEVGDEQQRREQALEALLNKRSEEAIALGKELADAQGQLTQITTDSDRMHNGMTEVRDSAC
jgi:chromosome segregation ATPase